jgi:hypothetical protein
VPRVDETEWVADPAPAPSLILKLLNLVDARAVARMVEEGRDLSIPSLAKPLIASAAASAIASWVSQYRPDIAEVLSTEKGKRWLSRQILRLFEGR